MRTDVLSRVPMFSTLAPHELELLAASSRIVKYPRRSVVFQEGDSGDFLLIVLEGRVKVTLLGDDGRETIVAVLGRLALLGEVALLDDAPRSATVVTLEATEFLRISRKPFLGLVKEHPAIALKLMTQLAAALRRSTEQIRTLTMFDVHGRLLRALMVMAQRQGEVAPSRAVIRPRPSATELASMIGCSRETVSRALNMLTRTGYVAVVEGGLAIESLAFRRYLPAMLPHFHALEVQ